MDIHLIVFLVVIVVIGLIGLAVLVCDISVLITVAKKEGNMTALAHLPPSCPLHCHMWLDDKGVTWVFSDELDKWVRHTPKESKDGYMVNGS